MYVYIAFRVYTFKYIYIYGTPPKKTKKLPGECVWGCHVKINKQINK